MGSAEIQRRRNNSIEITRKIMQQRNKAKCDSVFPVGREAVQEEVGKE